MANIVINIKGSVVKKSQLRKIIKGELTNLRSHQKPTE